MNKGARTEIERLKHRKRFKAPGLKPEEHYCYKEQVNHVYFESVAHINITEN